MDKTASSSHVRIPQMVGKYKVTGVIGRGGFAVVVLGVDSKTNDRVAIKIINRSEMNRLGIMPYLENELRLHSRLTHPNVVKIYDIIYDNDIIMIIMEYLSGGDLYSLINRGIHFTFEEQLRFAVELLQGLCYMHQRGISHRDIKPENILFDSNFHPKLIDFGLSRETSNLLHTLCGTPLFIAPEILTNEAYDGKKADIWALGVTIHIMSTNKFPWAPRNEMQLIKDIKKKSLEIVNEASGVLGILIKNCLIIDPNERPGCEQLLSLVEYSLKSTLMSPKINVPRSPSAESFLPQLTVTKDPAIISRLRKMSDRSLAKVIIPLKNRNLINS